MGKGREIGRRLAAARGHAGLTQEHAASLLGVSHARISEWEAGTHVPRISTIAKLARIYNTTVGDIMSEIQDENVTEGVSRATLSTFSESDLARQCLDLIARLSEFARSLQHPPAGRVEPVGWQESPAQRSPRRDTGGVAVALHRVAISSERRMKAFDPKAIGRRVRARREALKLSAAVLARQTDLKTKHGVEQIEEGIWPPGIEIRRHLVLQLADALSTTAAHLYGLDDEGK